jgi:hypothetical protein
MSFFLSCCGPHPDTLILGNHQQQSKVDISIFISHICIQRNSQVKWSTQPMWWIKMWSRHLNLGVLYTAAHPQMMGGAGLVSGGLSLFIFKPLVPCECLVHSYASFSQGPSVLTKSWLLYGSLGRIMLWWNHIWLCSSLLCQLAFISVQTQIWQALLLTVICRIHFRFFSKMSPQKEIKVKDTFLVRGGTIQSVRAENTVGFNCEHLRGRGEGGKVAWG